LDLEVSAELKKVPLLQWTAVVGETAALLGAALSIINPQVYQAGLSCIRQFAENLAKINKNETLGEVLRIWASPYTAFSLINNRDTPLHRDNGAGYSAMDLLVTVGDYHSGRLDLPGLGYRFLYSSGMVLAIAGCVVWHGAEAKGDQLCWANYLRESVLEAMGIPEPSWVSLADILSI